LGNIGKKAVVLLSGGLDSSTVLAIARNQGFNCHALTVAYGQRHEVELDAAARVAAHLGAVEHRVVRVDLGSFGGSSLTADIPVPLDRAHDQMTDIPNTYVPARNTVFLSLALAWAETLDCFDLFAGMNAIDYSGYPDCRPEFLRAFEQTANLATKAGVEGQGHFRVHAPLLRLDKAEIVRLAMALGVDLALTHSCYAPLVGAKPCGRCDSCQLRLKGFREAGQTDPLQYSS
jgi:7-cyano-7-deazaguanine synthase